MDWSMPGFPVLHTLPGFAQTYAHWISDAIQHLILCHPLLLLPSIFFSIEKFIHYIYTHHFFMYNGGLQSVSHSANRSIPIPLTKLPRSTYQKPVGNTHLPPSFSHVRALLMVTLSTKQSLLDPRVGKIPWRRKWQATPGFLPGKSHGQRSLVGYNAWRYKRVRHDWATEHTHTHTHRVNKEKAVVLYLLWCQKTNSSVCVLITQGQIFMRIHPTGMMDALSIWDTWVPSMLFTRPS